MKPIYKIKIAFVILACTLLSAGCVSSPGEKPPEAIAAANSALSNGVSHYEKNNYALATSYFNQALREFRSIDHQYGIASSCLNLSKTHLSLGDTDTAAAYLKQAQTIIEREPLTALQPHARIIAASIAIEHNQLTQAKEMLAPLLTADSNNEFTLAALQNRTRIAHAEISDSKDEAAHWTHIFEQKIKSGAGNQIHQARLARFKAALSDDIETQNQHFTAALNIYRQQTHRPGIAATLQEWADALIAQNQTEAANDKLLRALYIRQTLQDRNNSLKTLNSLARFTRDSRIQTWTEKLQDRNFKQWHEFVAAFNQFPE